jgi:hypothetical protein
MREADLGSQSANTTKLSFTLCSHVELHEPVRFSNACTLRRSRSAAQLNAGNRPASKGVTETMRRFTALALKADHFRNGSDPDVVLGDRTSASAECRHWSGRAVRWSSCAILLMLCASGSRLGRCNTCCRFGDAQRPQWRLGQFCNRWHDVRRCRRLHPHPTAIQTAVLT